MSIFDRLFKKNKEEVDVNINNNPKEQYTEVELDEEINWNIENEPENEPKNEPEIQTELNRNNEFNFTIDNLDDDDDQYNRYEEYRDRKDEAKNKPRFEPKKAEKNEAVTSVKKPKDIFMTKFDRDIEESESEEEFVINTPKDTKRKIQSKVGARLLDASKLSKKYEYQKLLHEINDNHIQIIYSEVSNSKTQWEVFERLEARNIPLDYLVALEITYEAVIESYKILKARNLNTKLVENDTYIQDKMEFDNYSKEVKNISKETKVENQYKQPDTSENINQTDEDFEYKSKKLEEPTEPTKIEPLDFFKTLSAKASNESIDINEKDDTDDLNGVSEEEEILAVANDLDIESKDNHTVSEDTEIIVKDEFNIEEDNKILSKDESPSESIDSLEIEEENQISIPFDENETEENKEEDSIPFDSPTESEIPASETKKDTLNRLLEFEEEMIDIEISPEYKDSLSVTTEEIEEPNDSQGKNEKEKGNKNIEFTIGSDGYVEYNQELPSKKEEPEIKVKNILEISKNVSLEELEKELFDNDQNTETKDEVSELKEHKEIKNKDEDTNIDIEPENTLNKNLIENNPKEEKNDISDINNINDVNNQEKSNEDVIIKKKNIYVVDTLIEFPNFEGYNFIRVTKMDDIHKYLLEKESLLILTNDIPQNIKKDLGQWLKNIISSNKKLRIVTLVNHEIKHHIIESTIVLNQSSLDFYFNTHPNDLYHVKETGSFTSLENIFSLD